MMEEVYILFAVFLLGFAMIAASAWKSVKRQIELTPAHSYYWRRWYAFFIVFVAIGMLLLLVLMTKASSGLYPRDLGVGLIVILILLLTAPIFIGIRYLETSTRRFLTERFMIIFVSAALPLLTYFSLIEILDIVLVAVLVLLSIMISISLLVWDLYKHRNTAP